MSKEKWRGPDATYLAYPEACSGLRAKSLRDFEYFARDGSLHGTEEHPLQPRTEGSVSSFALGFLERSIAFENLNPI